MRSLINSGHCAKELYNFKLIWGSVHSSHSVEWTQSKNKGSNHASLLSRGYLCRQRLKEQFGRIYSWQDGILIFQKELAHTTNSNASISWSHCATCWTSTGGTLAWVCPFYWKDSTRSSWCIIFSVCHEGESYKIHQANKAKLWYSLAFSLLHSGTYAQTQIDCAKKDKISSSDKSGCRMCYLSHVVNHL